MIRPNLRHFLLKESSIIFVLKPDKVKRALECPATNYSLTVYIQHTLTCELGVERGVPSTSLIQVFQILQEKISPRN